MLFIVPRSIIAPLLPFCGVYGPNVWSHQDVFSVYVGIAVGIMWHLYGQGWSCRAADVRVLAQG